MQASDVPKAPGPRAPPPAAARGDHPGTHRGPIDNRFLEALPDAARARLQRHMERVRVRVKERLFEPNQPIEHVYFPITAVVSLFTVMTTGARVEVTTVGNEGVVGVPVFLGTAPLGRAAGQIEGDAWRVPAAAFGAESRRVGALRDLLQRYMQAHIDELHHAAGCVRTHSLEQRCARALLATHDRVGEDPFRLTQECLASVLGVRRPTATNVMGAFRREGIVRYARGRVAVLDRAGLEAASCECYRAVRDGYDRVLGPAPTGR